MMRTVNVSKVIADHVVGKKHSMKHRKRIGVSVMVIGVSIAHFAANGNIVTSIVGDLIGYAIHGIGLIPFVESEEIECDPKTKICTKKKPKDKK